MGDYEQHLKDGEVSTGTSIFAVTFDGGVVMGADSRTTTGAYIANRVSNKLTPVADTIYCCRSGSAADTQAISDNVRMYLELHEAELGGNADVRTAANLFHKLVYGNKDRLMAGIICGGYDKHEGGSLYSIPLGGALVRQPWAIGGSGSTYIWAWCDANYREGMTKAECEQFVRTGLALAMSRDGSSGGVIRTVTIDASGVDRKFVAGNNLPRFFEGEQMALNREI
eukprot:TRINITY_DN155_c0_g1_i1.p1 TRINITY_DN155_c0_g1~~TRINITY_DN155_c0_g1_i1.p1  ORF type:complete len:226 (+),score=81.41 TRINITY_DN155_c0_g1_i1:114-791(+)